MREFEKDYGGRVSDKPAIRKEAGFAFWGFWAANSRAAAPLGNSEIAAPFGNSEIANPFLFSLQIEIPLEASFDLVVIPEFGRIFLQSV